MGRPPKTRGTEAEAGKPFRISNLFPEFKGKRAPFPKQELVFWWTRKGDCTGGGIVYQSGKGGGKTITGSAWIIWMHHVPAWKGMTSLIGRETYPSLLTSTADEFFKMVDQLPVGMVASASRPSKNSMGWVEWAIGGKTMLCSLSNSDTWESANLGAAWVDEGHRQNPVVCRDLMSRLRQPNAPRVALYTSNPAGKNWLYKLGHDESKERDLHWKWIEASSEDNPALPPDYINRLIRLYGYMTPAYRRWVRGESSALEGAVFTEFDPQAASRIHVVPPFELPRTWRRGRGLDYGYANPTAVVWGAYFPEDDAWFIYDLHYQSGLSVADHAEAIRKKDGDAFIQNFPADPSIFAAVHTRQDSGAQYSTADEFSWNGISLTRANNERKAGLERLQALIAVDSERTHYHTGQAGSPRIFIFDLPQLDPLIQELTNLEWERPEGSPSRNQPDDVQKKNDHAYDALRYLVMDVQRAALGEPIQPERRYRSTSRGVRVAY